MASWGENGPKSIDKRFDDYFEKDSQLKNSSTILRIF